MIIPSSLLFPNSSRSHSFHTMAMATQRRSRIVYLSPVLLMHLAFFLCLSSAWVLLPISSKTSCWTTRPSSTARYNIFDDWFGPKKKSSPAPPIPATSPAPVVEKNQEPPKEEPAVVSAVIKEPVVEMKQEPPVVEKYVVEEKKQVATPVAEKKEQVTSVVEEKKKEQPVVEKPVVEEKKQVAAPVAEKKEQVAPVVEEKKEEKAPEVKHADPSPDEILNGRVRWYNQQKGFGFLECADGRPDVFVHQTAIHKEGFRSLLKEEEVEFHLVKDDKGRYRAVDVTGPGGKQVIGVR